MDLTERLEGRLIPAVPVPFDGDGRMDRDSQARYAAHLAAQPIGGVALWAHTGRGLRLSPAERAGVLNDWTSALAGRHPVIAAAGAAPDLRDPSEATATARSMAEQAAALGADALLVHPPAFARGRPDLDRVVLRYHAEVARAGLPLILFYLYEAAGGVSYGPEVLAELLGRPEVVGIKVATLDRVMTFQDIASLVRDRFPDRLLISGEDRFLGYSLMCGARAALVGMGAACTALQAGLLRSYYDGDSKGFMRLSAAVDELGQQTFRAPMEGYIRRMLWCLVHEDVIPRGSAHDPWGPPLPDDEFDRIGEALRRLPPP